MSLYNLSSSLSSSSFVFFFFFFLFFRFSSYLFIHFRKSSFSFFIFEILRQSRTAPSPLDPDFLLFIFPLSFLIIHPNMLHPEKPAPHRQNSDSNSTDLSWFKLVSASKLHQAVFYCRSIKLIFLETNKVPYILVYKYNSCDGWHLDLLRKSWLFSHSLCIIRPKSSEQLW